MPARPVDGHSRAQPVAAGVWLSVWLFSAKIVAESVAGRFHWLGRWLEIAPAADGVTSQS